MAFEHEKRQALRILQGIEEGSMSAAESYQVLEDADPTLIHFILTWLRAHYPANHPASEAVVGRIVDICSRYPAIPQRAKAGADDPVVTWFEDAYAYRDVDGPTFIDLVVEKLEG